MRAGEAWLVTVEGESGIGKSALARRCLDAAEGFTVLSARADPAETDLDYGIVGQLLRRVDRASLSGYPLLAGAPPGSSPLGVGAQLLGLVGDLQASNPVAVFIDDVQWADRKSVEALTFMFRRLTVDPVLAVAVFRGNRDQLGETAHRMVVSIDQRLRLALAGLRPEDVAPLAEALGAGRLDDQTAQRVYEATAGHALYLQTVLSEGVSAGLGRSGRIEVPPSLAAALADQLAVLPAGTRAVLEMLAVVNTRLPAARLGDAAEVGSASAAIEPAVAAGLVDWWPQEASCPVAFRHALQRDAIYAGMTATKRRALHARAVSLVDVTSAWAHKVASLDGVDDELAGELEHAAADEAARGMLPLAATHLLWAADISAARGGRERRLLTAATHLMLADEARGLELRDAVEACAPSPLRGCVLGTMAFASGQLGDAELRLTEALAQAQADPAGQALAAIIANRLAGTYTLLGDGPKVIQFGSWALGTRTLGAASDSQTRTLVAIGASQVGGARDALAALGHLAEDPARVGPVHLDGLSFRGVFRLLAGDLPGAVRDLTASLRMARQGATFTLGLRAYFYLALAQYLSGAWDDVLLTADQGFSAAAIHPRRYELPLLHLAAGCVPAGRGATADAERHTAAAEQAAAALDYGQERLYAGMMHALLCQSRADYAGMAAALDRWQDDAVLDGRSRLYGVLWRPLLVEGLIGAGAGGRRGGPRPPAGSGRAGQLPAAGAGLAGGVAGRRTRRPRGRPAQLRAGGGSRRRALPRARGPAAAGARPPAAAHRKPPGRHRAAPPRQRAVRGPARGALRGAGARGTGRLRPAAAPRQKPSRPGHDRSGDRGRPPGRARPDQRRSGRRAVRDPQSRRVPPGQHLRQVRPEGPPAAAPLPERIAPDGPYLTAAAALRPLSFAAALPAHTRGLGRGRQENWGFSLGR